MKLLKLFKERRQIAQQRKLEQEDINERVLIAKVFNDRYTFRKEYAIKLERLPGNSKAGINPRRGFAWMCPECNKIHHPTYTSIFSGLQYPKCCSTLEGHRLQQGIRTE